MLITGNWLGIGVLVAGVTDGAGSVSLSDVGSAQMPEGIAHAPFFAPLFKFVSEAKDLEVAHQELEQFLRSPRVCDRTDDDLTLLLASLCQ
jgi:hypothetical protein